MSAIIRRKLEMKNGQSKNITGCELNEGESKIPRLESALLTQSKKNSWLLSREGRKRGKSRASEDFTKLLGERIRFSFLFSFHSSICFSTFLVYP